MRVIVQGQGEVTLTQKEFVASGGEGSVYARGGVAYKVYADAKRALAPGKITELASLKDPNIIKPEVVLLDPSSNAPVGYTMRFIRDALPLCQVISRAFREREGLDHAKMLKLVVKLQGLVAHTHKAGILIVDLNELNYLVNKAFDEVYGIDVDSYETAHYPATAIMPSVRDWTVNGHAFTEGSDWFSFACLSYQMFTGIHPYKGKHPTVHGLEERMKANISVFDPAVSVPKVVYPVDVIPPGYRAWFKAVFQDGKRVPPPSDPGTFVAAVVAARIVTGGAALDINEVAAFRDALLGYVESNGSSVAWLRDGVWVGGRPVLGPTHVQAIGFSPKMLHAVVAWTEGHDLRLFDATTQQPIAFTLRADDVMGYGGRIYVRSGERIVEVILNDLGNQVVPTPKVVTQVLEHASHLYEGVVIQDMLGSAFVSVYPRSGASHQMRVRELEAYKIVDARYDNRVLMVVGTLKAKAGKYDRLTVVFDEDHTTYAVTSTVHDVVPAGLNYIVLDNGTCVHLTEEEKLEVWNVGAPSRVRVVDDKVLGNDMRLVKYGGRVGFIRGDKVFSMRLK
jgi:hypothetical protein